jgi:HEAT repeat protein
MKVVVAMVLVLSAAGAVLLCSCAGTGPTLYQRLQDEDAKVRIAAVIEAGQTKDRKALALLVERLDDSEKDVRLYAIIALERITGQTLGYRYYDPAEAREQAVARWRQYIAKAATMPANAVTSARRSAA